MDTKIISANDAQVVALAANYLTTGDLVAIPTETVYGLGANGLNPEAVAKIFMTAVSLRPSAPSP